MEARHQLDVPLLRDRLSDMDLLHRTTAIWILDWMTHSCT